MLNSLSDYVHQVFDHCQRMGTLVKKGEKGTLADDFSTSRLVNYMICSPGHVVHTLIQSSLHHQIQVQKSSTHFLVSSTVLWCSFSSPCSVMPCRARWYRCLCDATENRWNKYPTVFWLAEPPTITVLWSTPWPAKAGCRRSEILVPWKDYYY